MNGAILADPGKPLEDRPQECGELVFGHLPGRHGEVAVTNAPMPRNVAVNGHIVRRVGEHHLGEFAAHERLVCGGVERVAA